LTKFAVLGGFIIFLAKLPSATNSAARS